MGHDDRACHDREHASRSLHKPTSTHRCVMEQDHHCCCCADDSHDADRFLVCCCVLFLTCIHVGMWACMCPFMPIQEAEIFVLRLPGLLCSSIHYAACRVVPILFEYSQVKRHCCVEQMLTRGGVALCPDGPSFSSGRLRKPPSTTPNARSSKQSTGTKRSASATQLGRKYPKSTRIFCPRGVETQNLFGAR